MAVVSSCGWEGVADPAVDTSETTGIDTSADITVVVGEVWARTSSAVAVDGALYMTLLASADSALIGVEVSPLVAADAEIHTTVHSLSGRTAHEGEDHPDGLAQMVPTDRYALPAEQRVAFEPGGDHVMLLGLATPLVAGRQFDLTLSFERSDAQTVTVTVSDDAP